MRIIGIMLLLLVLFVKCGNEEQVETVSATPDEMGEVIFDALVKDDAATIRKFIAAEIDINEIVDKSNLSEKKKEKKKKKLLKKTAFLQDDLAKQIAKIKKQNINWENTIFDWVDYKNFEKDSVTGADIIIVFSEDKVQYEIKLKECYQTQRGWVFIEGISFKGRRK